MRMRRAEHAESFRLHFQRLTLASLVSSAEAGVEEHVRKGRRLRARRAEHEAARLRTLAASLGLQQPQTSAGGEWVAGADSLRDRIGNYTRDLEAFPAVEESAAADFGAGPPVSATPSAASRARRLQALLGGCWLGCVAALVDSLLRTGIYSLASETLEWTLMPLTVVCFLAFIGIGEP